MQYSLARTEQGQTLGITAKMANRHGLIAGATGTGKTVTLRKMAEAFSDDGVPVFYGWHFHMSYHQGTLRFLLILF